MKYLLNTIPDTELRRHFDTARDEEGMPYKAPKRRLMAGRFLKYHRRPRIRNE